MKVDKTRIATVSSPVFWGSFLGMLFAAVVAGLSYLHIIGGASQQTVPGQSGYVVVFLSLLCVRYYASVIFLTYLDPMTPEVRGLDPRARRAVFWIQLLLIFGCSASASLLPVFGVGAACFIVISQGVMMARYWFIVGSFVISEQPKGDRHIILLIADIAILGSAVYYFLMEIAILTYDRGAAGLCLGAVFISFVSECAIGYYRSIRAFVRETRASLADPEPGPEEMAAGT